MRADGLSGTLKRMQTFLPYADFSASAAVLDNARLGKQRVEVLQILRALELPDYGWRNHPAVRMWRARTPALVVYGLACVQQWCGRGFDDSTADQIAEFSPQLRTVDQSELARQGLLPAWLGDERVHQSHRSRLVAKDPEFYEPIFPDAPAGLDYFWPLPDDVPASPPPADTDELWIVRPASSAALGEFLRHGVVGFGTDAGLDFDLDGLEMAAIKAALGRPSPGRRPGRQITAVARHRARARRPGGRRDRAGRSTPRRRDRRRLRLSPQGGTRLGALPQHSLGNRRRPLASSSVLLAAGRPSAVSRAVE